MITRVQIKNFRNLADVDVYLGPLTVLVGRNGAGKSTFLDALRFVRDALKNGLDTAISRRGGVAAIRRWSPRGRTNDIEISLEIEEADGLARYSLLISTSKVVKQRVKHEHLQINVEDQPSYNTSFETKNGRWVVAPTDYFLKAESTSGIAILADSLMLPGLSNFFSNMEPILRNITASSYYSVFPNTLKAPQRQTSELLLTEDAGNLATVIKSIIKKEQFEYDLVAALRKTVEGVQGIRIVDAGGYLVTELNHEIQGSQLAWFPLAQESDGTVRLIALLAALYQVGPHSLVAIEEPELSIHPGALAVLSEVIEEASTRNQVIISTQSPDLISRFNVDQLRVVEMVDGNTHIGPIEEGQQEVINKQLFSVGDLLRIEGLHVSHDESAIAHA